jgi:hypothetical protein
MQLMHEVDVDEQLAQGEVQDSHNLLDVLPNFPTGHMFEQLDPERKFGVVQLVHVVAVPEHFVQGASQFLHCQLLLSAYVPSGQVFEHVPAVRYKGLEH